MIALWHARAQAQSEPVALDSSACTSVDRDELRRILALEREVEDAPGALHVELRCDADRAWLRADRATRELELASVPEALRPRLLALAIAELRPAPPPRPVVTPSASPAASPSAQRFRLWAAAHGQLSSLAAGGVQVGSSIRLTSWLAWANAVAFTQGSLAIDRGDLRVRNASLRVGPALQRELGRFTFSAGPGVRVGFIGLRGQPSQRDVSGRRFDTWFVGPTLFATAALRFAEHGFVLFGLELTHTVREIHAEVRGGRTRALSPWLGGASLGVGTSW